MQTCGKDGSLQDGRIGGNPIVMQPHANIKRVEDQHELRGHVVITKLKDRRKREQTLE